MYPVYVQPWQIFESEKKFQFYVNPLIPLLKLPFCQSLVALLLT